MGESEMRDNLSGHIFIANAKMYFDFFFFLQLCESFIFKTDLYIYFFNFDLKIDSVLNVVAQK